ncbi:putative Ig domain-containing protein [Granulicella sp. L60]|uniref:beta strand repeat-containing protein n=1 Tax=Granulicella sp. L60 TaxID=1641866 RepID=UPI00131D87D2|nr:putative Ig domain-containing protein [Granulicella sp. L60]
MSSKLLPFLNADRLNTTVLNDNATGNSAVLIILHTTAMFMFLLTVCLAFTGCGSGGYAGGGVVSLSSSAVTLDAGQAFMINSKLSGAPSVSWALSSNACNSSGCGTLSSAVGSSVTYTAPAGITSQLQLTLTAGVTGTKDASAVSITVNPDPTISGTPSSGTVGSAYSATLTATGGTAPLKWSVASGSLPVGLSFNTTTGVISGTPTAPGTSSFTVQTTDSSDIPDSVTAKETIVISTGVGASGPLTVIGGNPPAGIVGAAYSTSLAASGGTAPYTWSVISGSLPAGLALSASTGVISGVPTAQGTYGFTAQVQDASGSHASAGFSIMINAAKSAVTLTLGNPPGATAGTPYTGTVVVTGGTAPYICTITGLPAGLTSSGCTISGTPTTAGTSTLTVTATDSGNPTTTKTGSVTLTVGPAAVVLTLGTLPNATVGTLYTGTVGVTGGTAPYTCTITGLPAGLTASGCTVSGTPTTAGTSTITVTATDSSSPAATKTGPVTLTIAPAAVVLTLGTLPNATVGTLYTGTVGVTGGTAPYTCMITGLPAGLTASSCTVSGTPPTAGTSTITVTATDSSSPAATKTGPVSLTIGPAAVVLTLGTLPNATVGTLYTATVGVSGGTSPYTCTITGLPAGLTASGCTVSGTPTTAGTSTLTVTATDSSSLAATKTGPVSLTIAPAAVVLTLGTLPDATVGTLYTSTIGVTGGTAPYSCSITGLPAGLTASGCTVSGTPTTAGTSTLTVTATDSSSPTATKTGPVSLTIAPAAVVLTLGTLPNATVGTLYTSTVGVSGGTAPYTCTITGAPAGLTASGCIVSGTPTVAGTSTLTVTATDSHSPAVTKTGPVVLTIAPAAVNLTLGTLPNGTVGNLYINTVGVTGGTAPYSCSITGLPAGLTAAGCAVSGTPTTAATSTLTVTATDSSSPVATKTGPVALTIVPASITLTLGTLANATVGTVYSGTVGVTGGTAPYSCTITGLPAGLVASGCTVSGTPTTAATSTLIVTATDSSSPIVAKTGPVPLTVLPAPALSLTGALPNAILNQAYSQTLQATGGVQPYSYSISTGSLPNGLTLSTAGVINGIPTAPGASSFTVTVTDNETPEQSTTNNYVLLVSYPSGVNNGELVGPYAFLFQGYDDVLVGILAYQTAAVGSFTADGIGGINSGELDSNHQTTGAASNQFLGTYEVGSDNRGMMALTTLNPDGTTAGTKIYAISVKAPVSPATVSTQAQMVEFDDNLVIGSRGSGSILAQQSTAFTSGLSGNYAFGVSGDTSCLVSCALGLSGPAAAVGQFSAAGGALSSGMSDANIAASNYPSESLTGTYQSADSNGRLTMSVTTTGTPSVYPTNYVAYMVNANQVFLMSDDSHASFVLLAGTAQSQTQANFDTTSLNGPIIGYENSQSNPGLLQTTLQDTLNLSTSTIFRTVAASGQCNFTNVDIAGINQLTSAINNLVGSLLPLNALQDLLGTYQSTGNASCSVSANGRGQLNYPQPSSVLSGLLNLLGLGANPPAPRTFYLTAPNKGFFLESGFAGLGNFEGQINQATFTVADFDGTFVYGSLPAATLAGINTSGSIHADGAGNATSVTDLNVGLGSLNILDLDVTSSGTYTINSTPPLFSTFSDANAGRFVYGTNVIYEISPTRFVLMDTNLITTSPTVTLLY